MCSGPCQGIQSSGQIEKADYTCGEGIAGSRKFLCIVPHAMQRYEPIGRVPCLWKNFAPQAEHPTRKPRVIFISGPIWSKYTRKQGKKRGLNE